MGLIPVIRADLFCVGVFQWGKRVRGCLPLIAGFCFEYSARMMDVPNASTKPQCEHRVVGILLTAWFVDQITSSRSDVVDSVVIQSSSFSSYPFCCILRPVRVSKSKCVVYLRCKTQRHVRKGYQVETVVLRLMYWATMHTYTIAMSMYVALEHF